MAGIAKEIWIDALMEPFYAEASFMDYFQDMTQFVEFNTINLADAGVDPVVYVNNATWPIQAVQRTDTPLAIPLDTLDTQTTLVRNIEQMESAYDKMESVLRGHRRSLLDTALRRGAWAASPNTDSPFTPIVSASGAVRADNSRKKATWEDVAALQTRLKLLNGPGVLVLVLHPLHAQDLRNEDRQFYKVMADQTKGIIANREGFIIMEYSNNAVYDGTNNKKAFGAAAAPSTDRYSSFAFMQDEIAKADGTVEMFERLKDPDQRGDLVGFQKRFKALTIRGKFMGALVSGT